MATELRNTFSRNGFGCIASSVALLAGAGLGLAPVAAATPTNTTSVQDTVNRLQALGYNVSFNGPVTAPLAFCNVIGIYPGDPGNVVAKQFQTIWIDVSCPPRNT